jgi:Na+-transporting NADH:ubiquinone oxidoreductase subunit A
MSRTIRIRKGADIRLKGRASSEVAQAARSAVYAVQPPHFHGVTPKVTAMPGDRVEAGSPLFHDKYNEHVQYLSPVSGTVKDVVRGAKRRVLAIEIEADASDTFRKFAPVNPATATREQVLEAVLAGGMFPFIEQRPFAVPANPKDTPRSIHVSGFSSAPLAPETAVVMSGRIEEFQTGIDALNRLAGPGGVHLGVKNGDRTFANIRNCEITSFDGPHPAGNVGVQIHAVAPINRGEVVWTMHMEDVANMGRLLLSGTYEPDRVIAAAGSEHPSPQHFAVRLGAQVSTVLCGFKGSNDVRVVSGDPLTGEKISVDGFIGAQHHQVTLLPEGNRPKFLLTTGWLGLGLDKFSLSHAFPTWLLPKSKEFTLDTCNNGEERAFVVSGQYDAVFPFDIYPEQLLKSIIVNDIDAMEKLGIYEVAPEDFALCEYACTSKIQSQRIVREGLDMLQKELG